MKVGDLVRFKVHHYQKSYGLGVLLDWYSSSRAKGDNRYWALFNNERIMVRLSELELVNENR